MKGNNYIAKCPICERWSLVKKKDDLNNNPFIDGTRTNKEHWWCNTKNCAFAERLNVIGTNGELALERKRLII